MPQRSERNETEAGDHREGETPVAGEVEREPCKGSADEDGQHRARIYERDRGAGSIGPETLRRVEDHLGRRTVDLPLGAEVPDGHHLEGDWRAVDSDRILLHRVRVAGLEG